MQASRAYSRSGPMLLSIPGDSAVATETMKSSGQSRSTPQLRYRSKTLVEDRSGLTSIDLAHEAASHDVCAARPNSMYPQVRSQDLEAKSRQIGRWRRVSPSPHRRWCPDGHAHMQSLPRLGHLGRPGGATLAPCAMRC